MEARARVVTITMALAAETPPDEGQYRQPSGTLRQRNTQYIVVGIHLQLQPGSGPEDKRDGQVEQQQKERKGPAGAGDGAQGEVFRKYHVKLTGQQEGGTEREKKQSEPGAFPHRGIERLSRLRVVGEPTGEVAWSRKHTEYCKQPDQHQRGQLDQ